jgi:hypothetical protein
VSPEPEFLEPLPPVAASASSEPDFGRVVVDAWTLVRANAGPLLKTWAAAALPAAAIGLAAAQLTGIDSREQAVAAWQAGRMLAFWSWLACTLGARVAEGAGLAAATVAADGVLAGRPCDPSDAWRRFGALLSPWLSTGVQHYARVAVGLALLIVPGVILSIRWCLWQYAVIVEGRSGGDALARSRQLVNAQPVGVLCAVWGGSALAGAVDWFTEMLAAVLPVLSAVAFALATGIGVEEAALPLVVLFGVLQLAVSAVAATWARVVVLLVYRGLAPRLTEPPERGYLV